MPDLKQNSPLGVYIEHCKKGELAYQVCTDDQSPVFFPRVVAPKSGSPNLEWRVSKGLGTVHSTTVVHAAKDQPPHNVALIDVDEGFRMMSRVEDVDPMQVRIGMRVKVRINPGDDKQPPFPVFVPAGSAKLAASNAAVLQSSAPPSPISARSRRIPARST